jgi:hypothetical protein
MRTTKTVAAPRKPGSAAWAIQRDSYPIAGKELVDTTTRIAIAYIRDRAEQYDNGSGIYAAFEELLGQFRANEHLEAFRHGELDDLIGDNS